MATQAWQQAVADERNRLARDLHDAVSQTLFSASIISEVLPKIWDKNPDEGRRRLEEVRQLTRGALAEMRSLLFELRPSALAESELENLIHQLAESITGRWRIPVAVTIRGKCAEPPSDVKMALYRIVQESLNNIAKHSGASHAEVSLECSNHSITLNIIDNGHGFDPDTSAHTSLGLGIMKERAININADLQIKSIPDKGTEITVIWSDEHKEELK